MPAPACEVLDEWEWMLEALENYVLWDADYAMDDLFMDVDAKTSRRRRQRVRHQRRLLHRDRSGPNGRRVGENSRIAAGAFSRVVDRNLLEAADRLEWPPRDLGRLIKIDTNAHPAVSATRC